MGGANFPLGIVVTAVDRASAVLSNVDHNTRRLANTFDSFRGRLTNAFQYHVIYRSLNLIERGLMSVAHAFPDLIGRGREWAQTIDDISDATGMSARSASEWAAVQQIVNGNTDGLSRALIILGRNAATNRAAFDQLGIATRDTNGRMLSAERILDNTRRRLSETGTSLLSTAAAQKAFGRGAGDLLDILTLTNGQWAIYVAQARRSGLILTEAGLQAAESWERTRRLLDATWTGIGAQVLQAVAPALISLSNGVTRALQDNLANITRFAVQVVNFLAGLIGGFLGIDFGMATVADRVDRAGEAAGRAGGRVRGLTEANLAGTKAAKGAAAGQDAYSRSLQRSIDAIDRQLRALERTDRRDESRRTQRELLADIAQARRELADIRSESIFASGMSEAEAELARQAQARDIMDAQGRVRDSERRLRDERRNQERADQRDRLQRRRDELQRLLSAHQQAASRIGRLAADAGKSFSTGMKPIRDLGEKGLPKLTEELKGVAEEARRSGQAIADAINTALFGEATLGMRGGVVVTVRQGGLIEHMRNLADFVGKLVGLLPGNTEGLAQLGVALVSLKLLYGPLAAVLRALGGGPTPVPTGGGGGGGGGGGVTGFGAAGMLTRAFGPAAMLPAAGDELKRKIMAATGLTWEQWKEQQASGMTVPEYKAWKRGGGKKPVRVRSSLDVSTFDLPDIRGMFGTPIAPRAVSGLPVPGIPGAGMADPLYFIRTAFRPLLGEGSPLGRGIGRVADDTGAAAVYGAQTAGNTGPLADDDLGVTNGNFGDIGSVDRWSAGRLGVTDPKAGTLDKVTTKVSVRTNKRDWPVVETQRAAVKAMSRADMVYLAAITATGIRNGLERRGGKLDRIADALYSGGKSVAWYTRYPAGLRPPSSSTKP